MPGKTRGNLPGLFPQTKKTMTGNIRWVYPVKERRYRLQKRPRNRTTGSVGRRQSAPARKGHPVSPFERIAKTIGKENRIRSSAVGGTGTIGGVKRSLGGKTSTTGTTSPREG